MNLFRQSLSLVMYDFFNDISETRTSCGFRENMIQDNKMIKNEELNLVNEWDKTFEDLKNGEYRLGGKSIC